MDLISYINSNAKASNEKFQSVKSRLKAILGEREPDMDLSDNSVVGDLILNRFANIVALAEEAQDCILSDIQLNNILNGNVCDCTFTEAFVKSLGIDALTSANTTGILRIKFKASEVDNFCTIYGTNKGDYKVLTIDPGTSIAFDDQMFRFFAPSDGPIYIQMPSANSNYFNAPIRLLSGNFYFASIDAEDGVYFDTGTVKANTYFVDLPIYGPSDASVPENSNPRTSLPAALLDNFILADGIFNVTPITPFETPTSLIELSKFAIKLYPSSNFTNKSGVISYLAKQFPNINCVTPITSNDEAGRIKYDDSFNNKLFTLDIYTKTGTPDSLIEVTQLVPTDHFNSFTFLAPPVEFKEVTWTALPTENPETGSPYTEKTITKINPATIAGEDTEYVNFTLIQNNTRLGDDLNILDFLRSKYAKFANCSLNSTPYPTDGTASIEPINANTMNGYIKVTYTYDPATVFIGNLINSPTCKQFFSTEVKSYVPYKVFPFVANYKSQISTYFDRQEAEEQIYQLLNKLSYPLIYSDAYIADVLINNGAYSIDSITTAGKIELSPFRCYAKSSGSGIKSYGAIPVKFIPANIGFNNLNKVTATVTIDNTTTSAVYNKQNIAMFAPRDLIVLQETGSSIS